MVRVLNIIGFILSLAAASAFSVSRASSQRNPSSLFAFSSVASYGRPTVATFRRSDVVMMPAVIEKETVRTGGGPAVLDRPQVEERRTVDEPTRRKERQGSEGWEVRIYNDGFNTREYVARSLVQVTGMTELAAYQTMMQAHKNGIAVVGRWVYERAEMYHEALKNNGIVCDLVPVDEE